MLVQGNPSVATIKRQQPEELIWCNEKYQEEEKRWQAKVEIMPGRNYRPQKSNGKEAEGDIFRLNKDKEVEEQKVI